jgi:hypothetical protein
MRITASRHPVSSRARKKRIVLLPLVLSLAMTLAACGGSSENTSQIPVTLSGNWQFTMAEQLNTDPTLPSFTGGLQGGFLIQSGSSVSGQVTFATVTQPPFGSGATPTQCNSGVATITGTISGQTVNLTAASVGMQTYALTGTLSFDGSTIVGTFTSTDGAGCGIAASSSWSASLIPILTSTSVQGTFHSMGGTAGLSEQEFLVSGALFQGANTGASSAPVTGNLNFGASGYPCFAGVTVAGQISGNTVSLQILGSNNTMVGQLGQPSSGTAAGLQPLTLVSTSGGYVLQSLNGTGYAVFAPGCGGGTLQAPADSGSVCLAVTSTTACQLPLTINPAVLGFPPQAVGSSKSTLLIALSNPSSSKVIDGLTITLTNNSGQNNFTESDNCGAGGAATNGQMFTLQPSQICSISIGYSPQQECSSGGSGAQCLGATLSIASAALQTVFDVPITGGISGAPATTSDPALLVPSQEFEKHAQ